jgi:16S rRNA (cytosine967-C5)-methyltransferase
VKGEKDARVVAREALLRIEQGAYANLVLPRMLERSGLAERDRRFATELVYGTTRMRRACDFLVDRFVLRPLDAPTRAVLRLGAHQLHHLGTPADAPVEWPDEATRLSYPDWVVGRLVADLGEADALAVLEEMDRPAEPVERPDGYVQDRASQLVVAAMAAGAGERVADVCAGPGGKATLLAGSGARVLATDVRPARAGLVAGAAERTGTADRVLVAAADGRCPPFRPGSLDRVLVDAPCSGLGVLRRRPDARWRIGPAAVGRLAGLQRELLDAAVPLLRPGGTLTYAVCTLTAEETTGVDQWLADAHPELQPLPPPGDPWRPEGRGALLLPQVAGTDGMFLLQLRRS